MVLGCPGKVELCDEKSRVLRNLRNMVDNLEMSMCRAQPCCGPCPPPYCSPPLCPPQPCCPAPPCCASAPCCAPQPCCAPPACMQPPCCLPPAPSCPEVMCSPRCRGGGCPPVCPCPPPGCCSPRCGPPRCGTPRCCKPRCCKPRERPPDVPILPLPPLPSVLVRSASETSINCPKFCLSVPKTNTGTQTTKRRVVPSRPKICKFPSRPSKCSRVSSTFCCLKPISDLELRGSIYIKCICKKRYGLQDTCARTGCHGSPACLSFPPCCGPSQLDKTYLGTKPCYLPCFRILPKCSLTGCKPVGDCFSLPSCMKLTRTCSDICCKKDEDCCSGVIRIVPSTCIAPCQQPCCPSCVSLCMYCEEINDSCSQDDQPSENNYEEKPIICCSPEYHTCRCIQSQCTCGKKCCEPPQSYEPNCYKTKYWVQKCTVSQGCEESRNRCDKKCEPKLSQIKESISNSTYICTSKKKTSSKEISCCPTMVSEEISACGEPCLKKDAETGCVAFVKNTNLLFQSCCKSNSGSLISETSSSPRNCAKCYNKEVVLKEKVCFKCCPEIYRQCCCKTCDGRPAGMVVHGVNPNFQLKRTKSYELRASIMYKGCECEKRYGLQDDCPRTGCHGSPECLTKPPTCGPSEYCDGKHLAKKFQKKKKITYVCPACCRPG